MIADRIRSIQAVSGGGGGGGLPVSGAALWLDGADSSTLFTDAGITPVSTSGDLVYQWSDKSGNNRHATQATSANRPTWVPPASGQNGFGGVRVQANRRLSLSTTYTLESDFTCFVVMKNASSLIAWLDSNGSTTVSSVAKTPLYYSGWGGGGGWTSSLKSGSPPTLNSASPFSGPSMLMFGRAGTSGTFSIDSAIYNATYSISAVAIDHAVGGLQNNISIDFSVFEQIVYPSALNAAEIESIKSYLKTKWATPNYDPASLILNMQGMAGTAVFTDESPNAFTVTPYGNAQLVSDATFGTVASFDGTGDYLQTDAASCFAGTQDFTVEFWLYWDAVPTADTAIIGALNSGGSSIGIFNYGNSLGLLKTGGTTFANFGSKSQITTGQWNHVAVTRSGSSHRCFINGMLSSSGVVTLSADWGTPTTCWIGRQGSTTAPGYLAGKIAPTRITKGVARYTSNFTPPTGLFPTS